MARRKRSAPMIDSLESRRLLSGATQIMPLNSFEVTSGKVALFSSVIAGTVTQSNGTVTFSSGATANITKTGTLVVKGTDSADAITVKTTTTGTSVTDNSNTVTFAAGVKRVLVEANGGDDHVDVSSFIRPSTVSGGGGDDVLVGGRASNLIGGAGDDKLVAIQTPDVINIQISGKTFTGSSDMRPSVLSGGTGNDTLVAQGADSVIGGGGKDTFVGMTSTPGTIDVSKPDTIEDFFHTTQGVEFSGTEIFRVVVTT